MGLDVAVCEVRRKAGTFLQAHQVLEEDISNQRRYDE